MIAFIALIGGLSLDDIVFIQVPLLVVIFVVVSAVAAFQRPRSTDKKKRKP